ncbi:MAG: hemerythrin domain-containing protein [Rhodospirillales bacterium]|nr:hemerythrin domain-containing protein [Rhodospirillales bacterium]
MKITDALLGEHSAFYMLFNQVEEIATIEGAMAQIRGATTVLAAMVESHATIEEELLFTALEPHLGREAGPIAQMYAEHEELERLLGQIEEAQDVAQATALVAEALSAARSHFRKEEQVLFPMAQNLLGDEALTRLGKAWAEARGVAIA